MYHVEEVAQFVEVEDVMEIVESDADTDDEEAEMMETAQAIQKVIFKMDAKFQKACRQVLLLNNQVKEIGTRYDRAVRDNQRTQRYFLRLRLCTVEGLRNMYYEYACRQADKIADLEQGMRKIGVEPVRIYHDQ